MIATSVTPAAAGTQELANNQQEPGARSEEHQRGATAQSPNLGAERPRRAPHRSPPRTPSAVTVTPSARQHYSSSYSY